MVKKVLVISLGGSLIVPKHDIDSKFLSKFIKVLKKHTSKYKFAVICGGGNVARKYINALKDEGKSIYLQSMIGISITRLNARFMNYFLGLNVDNELPMNMSQVKNKLRKNNIVFCGALRYEDKQTSDSTSAKLARYLNADFVNLTNVNGLYDKDPKKNKNAKLIKEITSKELHKKATSIRYHPGQHFVIDQYASKLILKNKINTFILGKSLKNFERFVIRSP